MLLGFGAGELTELLAHCVSLGVNAVRNPLDRKRAAWAHADRVATAAGLDMTTTWWPTAERYLSRVTKLRILEAVREAKGEAATEPLVGLKKTEMVEAAEQLLAVRDGCRLLRTPTPKSADAAVDPQPTAPNRLKP